MPAPSQPERDRPSSVDVVSVRLKDQVTLDNFQRDLATAATQLRTESGHALLFNILGMASYDPAIRDVYVTWYRAHKSRVRRVAVVTDKTMWRLIVATLGMATGGNTRAFERLEEAERWASSG